MDLSLSVCFSTAGYSVVESADYLLVGFRVGAVDMLVKEVWEYFTAYPSGYGGLLCGTI